MSYRECDGPGVYGECDHPAAVGGLCEGHAKQRQRWPDKPLAPLQPRYANTVERMDEAYIAWLDCDSEDDDVARLARQRVRSAINAHVRAAIREYVARLTPGPSEVPRQRARARNRLRPHNREATRRVQLALFGEGNSD